MEVCYQPDHSNDNLWEGLASTTGVSINDWKETPINSFSNLGITANSAYGAAKVGATAGTLGGPVGVAAG